MDANQDADKTLVTKYETVFCLFMAILAYLWRDNPNLVYPQILYLCLLLMAQNLMVGFVLRLWPAREGVLTALILANCATITAILEYSGSAESNLWVLYLLPIYMACLLLSRAEAILITLGALCFNAAYLIFEVMDWNAQSVFELALKCGVFLFTAAATSRIVERDRQTRRTLQTEKQEVKILEEQMQDQQVQLDDSEKMAEVGLVSSGMAHDVQNVLSVILGLTQVTLNGESVAPETASGLTRIQKSALMGKGIVSNFVSMARNERMSLAPWAVDDILKLVLTLLHGLLEQYKISLKLDLADRLPLVMGSRTGLQRLFLNLMSNAVRAMKEGGTLSIKTETAEGPAGREVRVTIEDTGPGIAEEMLAKLFKPFSTTMKDQGGTGLGLYICWEIAHQHQGRLHAENKPQGGARFVLSLPALASAKNPPL